MSVRFKKTGTSSVNDHNELLNKGQHTHQEIDEVMAELDVVRGDDLSINDRVTRIEDKGTDNSDRLDVIEPIVEDNKTKVESYGIRLDDVELVVGGLGQDMTEAQETLETHGSDINSIKSEIEQARGEEATLDERLDKIQGKLDTEPVGDLLVNSPQYVSETNSAKVVINGGDASINGTIVQKFTQFYTIDNIAINTTYHIFLKQDGTFTHSTDSTEPADAMRIGTLIVMGTLSALKTGDSRYFFTKGGGGGTVIDPELENRVDQLELDMGTVSQKATDNETAIGELTQGVSDNETAIGGVVTEVEQAREDNKGVIYDSLRDRLNNMQSRIEIMEGAGVVDNLSVFHYTSAPDTREYPQADFVVPKYPIGSHTVEVYLDGIRVDIDDDYIEYSDTVIRFLYDIPTKARVTIRCGGSIIHTHSTTEYTYTASGKVLQEVITGGISRTIDYIYDEAEVLQRKEITESNGQKKYIDYTYEGEQLKKEENAGAMYYVLQSGDTFDDSALKKRLDLLEEGEEVDIDFEYDENQNIVKETITDMSYATPIITKISDYSYNPDGSVATETVTRDGKTIEKSFVYDGGGNITKIQIRRLS